MDPRWSQGCIFDEEGMGYDDNEGSDYPVNPFDEDGTIDEDCCDG